MADNIIFRPPPEPAHVSVVRQYEDLVAILQYIRDNGQGVIDQGFDRVSSQIGFVVAASLPVTVTVAASGRIEQLSMREEHLKGTLFEKEFLPQLQKVLEAPITGSTGAHVGEGTFDIYVLWFDALKLKLGSIPFLPRPEPAHPSFSAELARAGSGYRPYQEPAHPFLARFRPPPEPAHPFLGRFRPPPEPAHWFDSRIQITQEEQVLIVALDEVYPELRLVERISASRRGHDVFLNPQPLPPGALAQRLEGLAAGPIPSPWRELIKLLVAELEKENPDPVPWRVNMLEELLDAVRRSDPQPSPWKARMLEELIEVIRRYVDGM
jgi:hypothetical protein